MMIAEEDLKGREESVVKLVRDGSTPVTRWMSAAKSAAARCTPGQSSADNRIGVAWPLLTIGNVEAEDLKVVQVFCPMA